jgi:hypothetical protein
LLFGRLAYCLICAHSSLRVFAWPLHEQTVAPGGGYALTPCANLNLRHQSEPFIFSTPVSPPEATPLAPTA